MTNVYDPVMQARAAGLFGSPTANYGVAEVRVKGAEIGWYLRPDGQAVRLPVDSGSKERYERKGFVYMRAWGTYSRTEVDTQFGVMKPETQWQQLARLSREHPDLAERAAIRQALKVVFSKNRAEVLPVQVCVCGMEFTKGESFSLHQTGCVQATLAETAPPDDAPAPAAFLPPAADASEGGVPPKSYPCAECGETFASGGAKGSHIRNAHRPKRGRTGLIGKRR